MIFAIIYFLLKILLLLIMLGFLGSFCYGMFFVLRKVLEEERKRKRK